MKEEDIIHSAMYRRSFLKRSAATGMGLAAGFSLDHLTDTAPLAQGAGDSPPPIRNQNRAYMEERKRIPVVKEVDVVVVGGGISGLFAALAAGKMGVSTVLIERFGMLGGNLGPGYLIGGGAAHAVNECLGSAGLPSVPRELVQRLKDISDGSIGNHADASTKISYLAFKMTEEAGVELVLSAYGCDPIVEDKVIKGIFVEGKSGRVAIKGKVLIDATGDANIAERGGARVIRYVAADWTSFQDSPGENVELYDEAGIYMMLGNVDVQEYRSFLKENEPRTTEEDVAWWVKHVSGPKVDFPPKALIPLMKKTMESGTFYAARVLEGPRITISSHWSHLAGRRFGDNIAGGRGAIAAGEIDMGNMDHISLLEKELRIHAFDTVRFLKEHVPGFGQDTYLMFLSPFLGSRGGPFIEGEHTLVLEDMMSGKLFDDVLFQSFLKPQAPIRMYGDWETDSFDVPYRMMLPKGFDNLYVIARGSAYVRRGHDGVGHMRARPLQMALGQACGTAAAVCIKSGRSAQTIDIRNLQRELLRQGFYLGDQERLKELNLAT